MGDGHPLNPLYCGIADIRTYQADPVMFRRVSTVPIAEPSTWERPIGLCARAVCLVCPVRWRSRDRGAIRHACFALL